MDFGSIHRPAHGWCLSIQTSLSDLPSPPNRAHQRSSASGAHDPTKGLSIEILTVPRPGGAISPSPAAPHGVRFQFAARVCSGDAGNERNAFRTFGACEEFHERLEALVVTGGLRQLSQEIRQNTPALEPRFRTLRVELDACPPGRLQLALKGGEGQICGRHYDFQVLDALVVGSPVQKPELCVLHCLPAASDGERPDRAPDPRVCSTLLCFRVLRIPGLLARRRRYDHQLVVKLLETLVEFYQEVLPLCALALWFAAQL